MRDKTRPLEIQGAKDGVKCHQDKVMLIGTKRGDGMSVAGEGLRKSMSSHTLGAL